MGRLFTQNPEVLADASAALELVPKQQLDTQIATRIATSLLGAASGVATLDSDSNLTVSQMPRQANSIGSASSGGGTITDDASAVSNNLNFTLTGTEVTVAVPTNGIDHQWRQVTAFASGGARTLTFHADFKRLTGVPNSLVIPSGGLARASYRCSTLTGSTLWILEAFAVIQ